MTALLFFAITDAKLQLDVSPGLTRRYEVTREYTNAEEKLQTLYVDQVNYKVEKERNEGRAKVTVSYRTTKTVPDGQAFPMSDDQFLEYHEERVPSGLVYLRQGYPYDPVTRERQLRVTDLMFVNDPVAIGSVWTRDIAEVTGDGIPPVKWEWTCTAIDDKSVTLKLKFKERECANPISADGIIVVDKASGWPNSVDVTLHNTQIPYSAENIVVDLHVIWRKS